MEEGDKEEAKATGKTTRIPTKMVCEIIQSLEIPSAATANATAPIKIEENVQEKDQMGEVCDSYNDITDRKSTSNATACEEDSEKELPVNSSANASRGKKNALVSEEELSSKSSGDSSTRKKNETASKGSAEELPDNQTAS